MTTRNALILAGSGMLSEVAQLLTADGWRVVLPSRRYSPLPVADELVGAASARKGFSSRAGGRGEDGRAVWVEADWDRPQELVGKVKKALTEPAELLVAWVHESYRRAVIGAVEPLLARGAPVVEVRTVAEMGSVPDEPGRMLIGHPTQQVLLGAVSEQNPPRPLRHEEIVDGVTVAVRRALEGRPSSLHHVGQRRPVSGH
ncbi:hypothetical protein [Qaidamihabitans albus]|uniref:hypothetical protein n=1 Tax=Qaidamihabitans albus TaxID=2795733 RepID=UPI001F3201D4|nr:hypothetical protein [Qaidamihabitans albus]